MRVIAGAAKGHKLFAPVGLQTRPTSDKIKGALFNMLVEAVPGAVFLDLFSGSGAIGVEALSRGAAHAVFVDSSADSIAVIRKNIAKTKCEDRALVMRAEAAEAIRRLASGALRFDLIFMDPPYYSDAAAEIAALIESAGLLRGGGLVALELARTQPLPAVAGLAVTKQKRYGGAQIVFLRKERLPL